MKTFTTANYVIPTILLAYGIDRVFIDWAGFIESDIWNVNANYPASKMCSNCMWITAAHLLHFLPFSCTSFGLVVGYNSVFWPFNKLTADSRRLPLRQCNRNRWTSSVAFHRRPTNRRTLKVTGDERRQWFSGVGAARRRHRLLVGAAAAAVVVGLRRRTSWYICCCCAWSRQVSVYILWLSWDVQKE